MNEYINIDERRVSKSILISRYISAALGIVLVICTILLWKTSENDSLLKLSRNVMATSNAHVNKIETKLENIEHALVEIAEVGPPNHPKNEKDWDLKSEFYINNITGIDNIIWIDRELIVRRTIQDDSNKFVINKKMNFEQKETNETDLIVPINNDGIIDGFIMGNINIPKLILSVEFDNNSYYMLQAFNKSGVIASSDNWTQAKKSILVEKKISFNNNVFTILIAPTKELIELNTRDSYRILFYGLFLSFAVSILVLVLQIFREKSKILTKTQKGLVEKQAELEEKNILLKSQLRDQQKLQSIGLLASGIAHEINNPITGIMNYSQIILDSSAIGSENAEYAKEIISETKRVSNLVNNLLQFSRQGHKNYSIARPEDIVDHTLALMRVLFKKDHIILQEQVSDDLPNIKCNSQQIQQVIMNLLTNARDALNDKYEGYNDNKIILLSCETIEKNDKPILRVTVEDHGNGIPAEVQEKMFNQFFTTKEIDKGTGLGLYISIEIIKDHEAELSFETKEGSYTKFYLDLPVNID